jgi:hypothetical protein
LNQKTGFNEEIPYVVNFIEKEEKSSEELEPNDTLENANIIWYE